MTTRKITSLVVLMFSICVSLLITGCGGQKAPATQPPGTQPSAASQPEAARPAGETGENYLARFKFKAGDGSEALSIKRYQDHDKIELNFEGTTSVFKGRTEVADRVKYKEIGRASCRERV